jgi:outer membrane protein OmpA-like peptidoglycan-associated protein
MIKEDLSIADLMSGMMMVFLLISVVFMLDVQQEKNAMGEIALMAEQSRSQLNHDLMQEFADDLKHWNAVILKDNTVRFKAPEVLFEPGKSELRPKFQVILDDFFPRYVSILQGYSHDIEAIRIEGHTSSDWYNADDVIIRYLNNVELSQQRALSTLKYCYQLDTVKDKREWLQKMLRANGLSFAQRIFNANGSENAEKSRRVEFKIVTKAEEKLHRILVKHLEE